jgi:hypothetical protein
MWLFNGIPACILAGAYKRAKIICGECLSSDLYYGNLYYKCNYITVVVVVVVFVAAAA